MVRAVTKTQVIASISTPVGPFTFTVEVAILLDRIPFAWKEKGRRIISDGEGMTERNEI